MLYYSNQPAITLFDDVTLTATFAGNRKAFETGGVSKLSLDIIYDMDAGETANTFDFQLEASTNATDWFSLVIDSTTTVSELSPRVWQMSEGSLNVIVDVAYKYMRMSVRETGVASTFGTASVTATLSGF
jgi:hypothetical protein